MKRPRIILARQLACALGDLTWAYLCNVARLVRAAWRAA